MGQPGLPGSQFPSEDATIRRIQDLERAVQELRSANQLAPAGIKAVDGGIIVDGSETVNGPLTINGATSVTGNADFTGNVHIGGTLDLPAGIIGNDALASPLMAVNFYANADGFTVPLGTDTTIATASTTVPAGYTSLSVIATSTLFVYNPNTTSDYVTGRIYIDAPGSAKPNSFGRATPAYIGANGGSINSAPTNMASIGALVAGSTISVRLTVHTDTAAIASASNGATIDVMVWFTR